MKKENPSYARLTNTVMSTPFIPLLQSFQASRRRPTVEFPSWYQKRIFFSLLPRRLPDSTIPIWTSNGIYK